MLVSYNKATDTATMSGTIEAIDRAVELANLFSDVEVSAIKSMLHSDAGRLAYAVLCNQADTLVVRALIDELQAQYLSSETAKPYVTRGALTAELEDILRAKTITPYRRSRINKALKRDCLHCHGGGKVPKVKRIDSGINTLLNPRRVRHEIDSRSPDCPTCKGTGIKPELANGTKVGVTVEITKEDIVGEKLPVIFMEDMPEQTSEVLKRLFE